MTIIVEPGDPRHPEATALLRQSHQLMQELFAPEENHFLSIDALCGEDILFFVAREYDTTLGTGALALRHDAGGPYGEVKSMFTAPFARGRGAAGLILDRLENEARTRDLPVIRLETGNLLEAAHRVYRARGFTDCGPFGDYIAHPSSVFMEKRLS